MGDVRPFPLERRDGPASVTVCRCGHPDIEHEPRRYGYPCVADGCRCRSLMPAARPHSTKLPPSRKAAVSAAAALYQMGRAILRDEYPLRPSKVLVVLLNETDSFATWGGGKLSYWDTPDGVGQLQRMASHASAWWAAKRAREPLPAQVSCRAGRLERAKVEARMKQVDAVRRPHACECGDRFASPIGRAQHQRTCLARETCPHCGGKHDGSRSYEYPNETRVIITLHCARDPLHRWSKTQTRRPRRRAVGR